MFLNYITIIVYIYLFLCRVQGRTCHLQWDMVCIRTYIASRTGSELGISSAAGVVRPPVWQVGAVFRSELAAAREGRVHQRVRTDRRANRNPARKTAAESIVGQA